MRRLLTVVAALAVCLAGAPGPGSALAHFARITASHSVTDGQVGSYDFQVQQASASCGYERGRLSTITLAAPRAAGRQEWEPVGQYILWAAYLQAKPVGGRWHTVGGPHSAAPVVGHYGQLAQLPTVSISHVNGTLNTAYRVHEVIDWYFDDRNAAIPQGKASATLTRYRTAGSKGSSKDCVGVLRPKLAERGPQSNDELDRVQFAFGAQAHGSRVHYSIQNGALPDGLRLNPRTGVVSGVISAGAVNLTTDYHELREATFHATVAARSHGVTSSRKLTWKVRDTAFVMPSYYGRYGCGDCDGHPEPVPEIVVYGPHLSFGCTTQDPAGIPAGQYSVIYQQDVQQPDGSLTSSAGQVERYGDVFKWWYYNSTC